MKKITKKGAVKLSKTGIFALVLFFFLNVPVYSNVSNEIGKLYLTIANSFFRENRLEETEVFLSRAALFDRSLSDIHYINALIIMRLNGNLNNSINYLRRAITHRNWYLYNENDAFFELGRLYTRIRDYNRALAVLFVIKDQFINDQVFLDLYTRALIKTGDFASAQKYLAYAISKFPGNDLFVKRLAGLDSSFRENLLMRVLDNNNLYGYSPEVILELSRLSQDRGVKRELISLAERAGNNSIELLFERIAVAGNATLNDVVIFSQLNGFSDFRNIRTIKSMIRDREVADFLREYFNVYSGLIKEDVNNDGIFERIMSVENGIPQWYSEDRNQNNVNDLFVGFRNGRPAFININESMFVAYYEYPFVKTVILYGRNFSETYNFRNNRTPFDILEFSNPLVPPSLRDINISELFDSIKRRADTYVKNDLDNFTVLLKYFKTENIVNFKSFDQVNSIVRRGVSRNDRILFRESDIGRDNTFEIREIFRDGVLYEIRFVGSGDGISEFRIRDGVKYWDFDGDGIFDAREWTVDTDAGRIRYREFATNMDGVFNFTAKYKDGALVKVRRNDVWKNVYHDRRNNIFWIGEKRVEIGSTANIRSGTYIHSGNNTVYIIKIGSDFFAEVIN
ncbi:MAG: tetratricopeptide repeat protein [Spirochaetes bacterium]|nr:tetratricopeptide repeat protein [Spirochaetota bacterium]